MFMTDLEKKSFNKVLANFQFHCKEIKIFNAIKIKVKRDIFEYFLEFIYISFYISFKTS